MDIVVPLHEELIRGAVTKKEESFQVGTRRCRICSEQNKTRVLSGPVCITRSALCMLRCFLSLPRRFWVPIDDHMKYHEGFPLQVLWT